MDRMDIDSEWARLKVEWLINWVLDLLARGVEL